MYDAYSEIQYQYLNEASKKVCYNLDQSHPDYEELMKLKERLLTKSSYCRIYTFGQVTYSLDPESISLMNQIYRLEAERNYIDQFRRNYNDITIAVIGHSLNVDLDFRLYVELEIKKKESEIYLGISSFSPDMYEGKVQNVSGGDIISLRKTWAITCGRRHCIQLDTYDWSHDGFKRFVKGDTVGCYINFSQPKKEISFYVNNIQQGPIFEIDRQSLEKEIQIWTYADTESDEIWVSDIHWGSMPSKLHCEFDWPQQTENFNNFEGQKDWGSLNAFS